MTRYHEGQPLYDPAPGEWCYALVTSLSPHAGVLTFRGDLALRYVRAENTVECVDASMLFASAVAEIKANDADTSPAGVEAWLTRIGVPSPAVPDFVLMARANAAHLRERDGWCRKCGWDSQDKRCPAEHPADCDGVV